MGMESQGQQYSFMACRTWVSFIFLHCCPSTWSSSPWQVPPESQSDNGNPALSMTFQIFKREEGRAKDIPKSASLKHFPELPQNISTYGSLVMSVTQPCLFTRQVGDIMVAQGRPCCSDNRGGASERKAWSRCHIRALV